jgi:hypothetical protein
LLPIAAVITPAAINVAPNQEVVNAMLSTPRQLYFDPEKYGTLLFSGQAEYIAPSPDTLKAAYGSAFTGSILSIPASELNMTYTLQLNGPAISCDVPSYSVIEDAYDTFMDQLYKDRSPGTETQYVYISWVPSPNGPYNFTDTTQALDLNSTDAAHIYILPNTGVVGPTAINKTNDTANVIDAYHGYQELLKCSLYNASYTVFFNFSYPQQNIDILSRKLLNPVSASTDISQWKSPNEDPPYIVEQRAQRICYQSIMEAFGRLLVGYETEKDGLTVNEQTSWNMMPIDWTSRNAAQLGLEVMFQNLTMSMLGVSSLT